MIKIGAVLSKSDQITNFLRKRINSGELLKGEKILSSRKLAINFSTSKQVIESAFNKLEAEGLVEKQARKGVFVKKIDAVKDVKEIYLLGIGVDEKDHYFNNIIKMTYPPYLKDNFTFIIRTCPRNLPVEKILDMELRRINNTLGLDCVLIDAVGLGRKAVEKCLELDLPIIFLGDFKYESDLSDLKFNQITADNEVLGEAQVLYLARQGVNEITLIIASLNYSFTKQFYDGVLKTAKRLDIKIKLVEFSEEMSNTPFSNNSIELINILKNAYTNNLLSSSVIINGIVSGPVISVLNKMTEKRLKDITFAPNFNIDYVPFYKIISDRVEKIIENKQGFERVRIKLPINSSNC